MQRQQSQHAQVAARAGRWRTPATPPASLTARTSGSLAPKLRRGSGPAPASAHAQPVVWAAGQQQLAAGRVARSEVKPMPMLASAACCRVRRAPAACRIGRAAPRGGMAGRAAASRPSSHCCTRPPERAPWQTCGWYKGCPPGAPWPEVEGHFLRHYTTQYMWRPVQLSRHRRAPTAHPCPNPAHTTIDHTPTPSELSTPSTAAWRRQDPAFWPCPTAFKGLPSTRSSGGQGLRGEQPHGAAWGTEWPLRVRCEGRASGSARSPWHRTWVEGPYMPRVSVSQPEVSVEPQH